MLILNKTKSSYSDWYQRNKERLSAKRKKQYAENAEYRQRALESSGRRRRGERTPPTPADAQISFTQAAGRLGIGASTLREWCRKQLFPEPKHHNRGLWFTQKQVELLRPLKGFFKKYRMRPSKISEPILAELRASIFANWI